MMEVSLRRLMRSDCEIYRAFRLEAFQKSSESFSESFEDEVDQPIDFFQSLMGFDAEHFTIGAFTTDNQLVGIASFKRDKRSKARHKNYLHTMYVSHAFRGHGIARSILANIIEVAKGLVGVEQIHLWVLNPETSVAKRLYLSAGFIPQGALVKADLIIAGNYVDAY